MRINQVSPQIRQIMHRWEGFYHLPDGILYAIAKQETGLNPTRIGSLGERGPYQFLPANLQKFGINNPLDWNQTSAAAAKYLAELNKMAHGNWYATISAYNAGPGEGHIQEALNGHFVNPSYVHGVMSNYHQALADLGAAPAPHLMNANYTPAPAASSSPASTDDPAKLLSLLNSLKPGSQGTNPVASQAFNLNPEPAPQPLTVTKLPNGLPAYTGGGVMPPHINGGAFTQGLQNVPSSAAATAPAPAAPGGGDINNLLSMIEQAKKMPPPKPQTVPANAPGTPAEAKPEAQNPLTRPMTPAQQAAQLPSNITPPVSSNPFVSAIQGFVNHGNQMGAGIAQGALAFGHWLGMDDTGAIQRNAQIIRNLQGEDTANKAAHPFAARAGGLMGDVATTLPFAAIPGLGESKIPGFLGTLSEGMRLGAADGLMEPANPDKPDYIPQKVGQTAAGLMGGALAGSLVHGGSELLGKLGRNAINKVVPPSPTVTAIDSTGALTPQAQTAIKDMGLESLPNGVLDTLKANGQDWAQKGIPVPSQIRAAQGLSLNPPVNLTQGAMSQDAGQLAKEGDWAAKSPMMQQALQANNHALAQNFRNLPSVAGGAARDPSDLTSVFGAFAPYNGSNVSFPGLAGKVQAITKQATPDPAAIFNTIRAASPEDVSQFMTTLNGLGTAGQTAANDIRSVMANQLANRVLSTAPKDAAGNPVISHPVIDQALNSVGNNTFNAAVGPEVSNQLNTLSNVAGNSFNPNATAQPPQPSGGGLLGYGATLLHHVPNFGIMKMLELPKALMEEHAKHLIADSIYPIEAAGSAPPPAIQPVIKGLTRGAARAGGAMFGRAVVDTPQDTTPQGLLMPQQQQQQSTIQGLQAIQPAALNSGNVPGLLSPGMFNAATNPAMLQAAMQMGLLNAPMVAPQGMGGLLLM